MACFIVSYDLPAGSDYAPLHERLRQYPGWAMITQSTWAVTLEPGSAVQVRDYLRPAVPAGGRLFVIRSARDGAWNNVICNNDWLVERL